MENPIRRREQLKTSNEAVGSHRRNDCKALYIEIRQDVLDELTENLQSARKQLKEEREQLEKVKKQRDTAWEDLHQAGEISTTDAVNFNFSRRSASNFRNNSRTWALKNLLGVKTSTNCR